MYVAVLCGVIAGGVAGTWVFPGNASASIDCTHHDLNDMSTTQTHFGTGVNGSYGMYVYNNAPVTCTHTSSILVRNAANEDVEVGWIDGVVGVALDPTGHKCKDSVTGNLSMGTGSPEAFRAHVTTASGFTCTVFPALNPPLPLGWNTWAVKNTGGSGTFVWRFVLNGDANALGDGLTMPFDSAPSWTNGEAYGPSETETASFRGLQYLNGSNTWSDWGNAICEYHTRDGVHGGPYNSHIATFPTWIEVLTTGTEC